MLKSNLQETQRTNTGILASPHLKSTLLQARKTTGRQESSKKAPTLQALTAGLRNKETRLKRSSARWENKGERFRTNPTTKPRKEFLSEGSRTHLKPELQALRSGNPLLPTSCNHANPLVHITTCKTSTRTLNLEFGIKSYRDLKGARCSRVAGAQGARVRNEEALRVLNPQGRRSKGSPALPNGRGRSPQGSATRRKALRICCQVANGRKKALCSKTVKTPHSAGALFN